MTITGTLRNLAAGTAAVVLALNISTVTAEASNQAVDRFTVIAGGWQLERRCNHLDEQSHAELGAVAARAEVEVAREIGSDTVRDIMAAARAFGEERGANCGSQTREEVLLSLTLAQGYAQERGEVEAAAPVDVVEENQVATADVQTVPTEEPVSTQALVRFGQQTEAYYLQRRCGHLAYSEDYHFWQLIAHQHAAMLRRFGSGAIRRMQNEAESSANSPSVSCGTQTRNTVSAAYAGIRADVANN